MKTILIRFICLIVLTNTAFSCTNSDKKTSDSTATQQPTNLSTTDSLSIDLVALNNQNAFKNTQEVVVDDPVYHKTKHYNAVVLKEVLEKYSSIKNLNIAETKVVFECEDGYKPEMPLEKLLSAKAFLAISDVDAPKGKSWEPLIKNKEETKIEPFYIVYQGVPVDDVEYKWPYNLVKIHFAPLHENDAVLLPKDESAMAGYKFYKSRCQTCHAINKIGGKMGPELNTPKSVTEYWKREHLVAYIQNPAAYRNDVKMPNLGIKAEEAEEIVKYLEIMAKQK